MSPFQDIINSQNPARIRTNIRNATTGQVKALLETVSSGAVPRPEDISILVSPAAGELLEPMARLAKAVPQALRQNHPVICPFVYLQLLQQFLRLLRVLRP